MTLTELSVVIAITVALLAIGAAVWPTLAANQQVANGSDRLQEWLVTARQWAQRDQQTRGIRLVGLKYDPLNPNSATTTGQLQYIGNPDDLSGGTLTLDTAAVGGIRKIFLTGIDVTGGWGASQAYKQNWLVQINDTLDIMPGTALGNAWVQSGTGVQLQQNRTLLTILDVTPNQANPPTQATILVEDSTNNPLPNWITSIPGITLNGITDYRIHRAPRPLPGQDVLQLPPDIVVDISLGDSPYYPPGSQFNKSPTNVGYALWVSDNGSLANSGYYDILFTPQGNVDTSRMQSPASKIILWVRDGATTPPQQYTGASQQVAPSEQRLIAVYSLTGAVAAHPANSSGSYITDPFSYVRDGKGSGM